MGIVVDSLFWVMQDLSHQPPVGKPYTLCTFKPKP